VNVRQGQRSVWGQYHIVNAIVLLYCTTHVHSAVYAMSRCTTVCLSVCPPQLSNLNTLLTAGGWSSMVGCTLAPPGEYHWIVHVRRRCGLLSNYFDHLLLLTAAAAAVVLVVVVVTDVETLKIYLKTLKTGDVKRNVWKLCINVTYHNSHV